MMSFLSEDELTKGKAQGGIIGPNSVAENNRIQQRIRDFNLDPFIQSHSPPGLATLWTISKGGVDAHKAERSASLPLPGGLPLILE